MESASVRLALQLNKLLRHFGVAIARYPAAADHRRRALLKNHGVSAVIDIGANVGQYAVSLREHGYSGRIISYEPLPDACEVLRRKSHGDPKWKVVNKAVGDAAGLVTLNVANNSKSSSTLPMLRRHVDAEKDSQTIGAIEVQSITLQDALADTTSETVMVKIDTQGSEYKILTAGAGTLSSLALIEVELSLVPLYEDQKLFGAVNSLLLAAGFELVSLAEGFFDRETGELLQIDGIYRNSRLTAKDS